MRGGDLADGVAVLLEDDELGEDLLFDGQLLRQAKDFGRGGVALLDEVHVVLGKGLELEFGGEGED